MIVDSDNMPLEQPAKRRRVQFDPTINLGHILTFAGFMITGSVAYFDLRERITVAEVRMGVVSIEVEAEKSRTRETLREVRDDMREVRRGVDELLRARQRVGDK